MQPIPFACSFCAIDREARCACCRQAIKPAVPAATAPLPTASSVTTPPAAQGNNETQPPGAPSPVWGQQQAPPQSRQMGSGDAPGGQPLDWQRLESIGQRLSMPGNGQRLDSLPGGQRLESLAGLAPFPRPCAATHLKDWRPALLLCSIMPPHLPPA